MRGVPQDGAVGWAGVSSWRAVKAKEESLDLSAVKAQNGFM